MHTYLRVLFVLIVVCGISAIWNPAQTPITSPASTFSQSVMYAPRETDAPEKKKEKQKDQPQPQIATRGPVKEGPLRIPVSVLDEKGKIVLGLQASNFRVFIDTKKVEIAKVELKPEPLNVILLIDTSPSTVYTSKAMRAMATAIVAELEELDRVSMIRFESEAKILTDLTDDRKRIRSAIEEIDLGIRGTALYDAMKFTFETAIPSIEGHTVVFLLTDGVDTTSKNATYASSLELAEKNDTTIIPIFFDTFGRNSIDAGGAYNNSVRGGVSGSISAELIEKSQKANERIKVEYERGKMYLNDLVFLSGGRALTGKSFEIAPKETAAQMVAELRQRYILTFTPGEGGIEGQRRQILVRVDRPNLAVLARGSYFVKGK